MSRKYILDKDDTVEIDGHTLYRVVYLRYPNVLGGYIEHESNLYHEGSARVLDNAKVWGAAVVRDSAVVTDRALVCGGATLRNYAHVCDDSHVLGAADVGGYARVSGFTVLRGTATASGSAVLHNACATNPSEIFCAQLIPYGITVTPVNVAIGCKIIPRAALDSITHSLAEIIDSKFRARVIYDSYVSFIKTAYALMDHYSAIASEEVQDE